MITLPYGLLINLFFTMQYTSEGELQADAIEKPIVPAVVPT